VDCVFVRIWTRRHFRVDHKRVSTSTPDFALKDNRLASSSLDAYQVPVAGEDAQGFLWDGVFHTGSASLIRCRVEVRSWFVNKYSRDILAPKIDKTSCFDTERRLGIPFEASQNINMNSC
jgi:hypothetical protein